MWLELAIVIAILLILFSATSSQANANANASERFDVYNNHPMGAETVYETTGIPATGEVEDFTMKEAERFAKYTWSEKDPNGLDVYDHYYENYVDLNKYADQRPYTAPDEYSYRDVGGNIGVNSVYDSKFVVLSPPNMESYSNYNITGMADPDPLYMTVNGEDIVLNQKNF
jgi:hypothetical protein